jgi:hypothetical protein
LTRGGAARQGQVCVTGRQAETNRPGISFDKGVCNAGRRLQHGHATVLDPDRPHATINTRAEHHVRLAYMDALVLIRHDGSTKCPRSTIVHHRRFSQTN